jgi:hypothetical protein
VPKQLSNITPQKVFKLYVQLNKNVPMEDGDFTIEMGMVFYFYYYRNSSSCLLHQLFIKHKYSKIEKKDEAWGIVLMKRLREMEQEKLKMMYIRLLQMEKKYLVA